MCMCVSIAALLVCAMYYGVVWCYVCVCKNVYLRLLLHEPFKVKEYVCMYVCSARFAVQASLDLYSRILNVIERNNYDNFRKRAFTTKLVYVQYAMYALCKSFKRILRDCRRSCRSYRRRTWKPAILPCPKSSYICHIFTIALDKNRENRKNDTIWDVAKYSRAYILISHVEWNFGLDMYEL